MHSTDTAGLRLPPHNTNAVPAAQLKWLPQNEVNSVHVLNWMWVAETTPDKAATTSLTVSPGVEEGPNHLAWFPPADYQGESRQGALSLTDGPTGTQWLMLRVVSYLIGERLLWTACNVAACRFVSRVTALRRTACLWLFGGGEQVRSQRPVSNELHHPALQTQHCTAALGCPLDFRSKLATVSDTGVTLTALRWGNRRPGD